MYLLKKGIRKTKRFVERLVVRQRQSPDRIRQRLQVKCPREFHGHKDYGGWMICPTSLSPQSVVYSFGVGEDISFDVSLITKYGVQIFAFDPTPKSIAWIDAQELPEQFHFFELGLAEYDGIAKFYPPENPEHVSYTILDAQHTANSPIEVEVRRLKTIADMLGHRNIDILKMDIEGAEYAVVEDLVNTESIEICQVLVEFHHHFPTVKASQTRNAVVLLNQYNYKIFHVSKSGYEYCLIKQ